MKCFSVSLAIFWLLSAHHLAAQGKTGLKSGKVTAEDFAPVVSPAVDSSTNAIILSDLGVTEFEGNKNGWFNYVYRRKTRIKILNKKGFELATVKIPLYIHDDDKELVSEVTASTYNIDNGQVVETKLPKTDLFAEKKDKNHLEQRFTMPAVKEGSVIEYSYTINSDFIFNIPTWEFQNINYPCLWSEYQVTIPSLLIYVFQTNGVHPFTVDKADIGHANYLVTKAKEQRRYGLAEDERMNVSAGTIKHRWAIKDIPAFYVENYLSSPVNYIDKIEFQLHKTNNGETSTDVMNTWKKATEELLQREDFGAFMNGEANNFWLDKAVAAITKDNAASLQQARDIYYYLTRNFTCTNYYNRYITTTLQDVYKKHNGNVGEINLLLTAMLQRKGIDASPVLLSTREFGYNYAGYPMMDRLNYVISRVSIGDKIYYLDASHANLGFGNLPGNCYNGHARVISRTDSASVYFLADSIKEKKLTLVNIINDEKNKGVLKGKFQSQLGNIESYALREAIAQKGEQSYFNDIKTMARGDAELTAGWIDSLHRPEDPVQVEAEFNLKVDDNAGLLYFSPVLWAGYKTNPFAAAMRKYPVEMDYPLNDTYMLMIDIPEGYAVEELPKMTRITYNGGEGLFEYLVQKSETFVQLRCSLKFEKAHFAPEDYDALRDFFGHVVKKESEQIVFKKK